MTESAQYQIIDVPSDGPDMDEQLGTKFKFWYRDADGLILFKQGRENTGENWAEKVVCEIAGALGIPHAHYELATWKGRQGVITPTFIPVGFRLVFANELFRRQKQGNGNQYRNTDHDIDSIMRFLSRRITISTDLLSSGLQRSSEVFLAYLMLDALVGNTDRHDENWGWLLTGKGEELAPTFDHAASLGRELNDAAKKKRLETTDVNFKLEAYAAKATSALYSGKKKLKTLEAFNVASSYEQNASQRWLGKMESEIDLLRIQQILAAVPDIFMSDLSKEFASKLILINKDRLLQDNTK